MSFFLFAGDVYYPGGGWEDYKGEYATYDEAIMAAESSKCDWWHIVNTLNLKIVEHNSD